MILLAKEAIRKNMLFKRRGLDDIVVEELSAKIQDHLFSSNLFKEARTIMTYLSYPKEVQTDNIVTKGLKLNKTLSVPVCIKQKTTLFPSAITDLNQVETGFFNLREPKSQFVNRIEPHLLDLIIIPGVAFDLNGNRIGHGKGYYDNFLRTMPASIPKVALAFDYQIIDSPWEVESWDVKMDAIISESGWVYKDFHRGE